MPGVRVDRGSDGVVYLTGALDRDSGRDLEVRIAHEADEDGPIVVDLRNVFSWDTIGISALLRLAKIAHPARVVLRSPPTNLANVLDLVSLDDFAIRVGGRTTDRVLEIRERRDTSTDGPGAWSVIAAGRAAFELSVRETRRLASAFWDLRSRSTEVAARARALRRRAVAIRAAS